MCELCSCLLQPMQPFLASTQVRAAAWAPNLGTHALHSHSSLQRPLGRLSLHCYVRLEFVNVFYGGQRSSPCPASLLPLQAAAAQPPVRDSIDPVSLRSWLNSPWSSSLEEDIFKVQGGSRRGLRSQEKMAGRPLFGIHPLFAFPSICANP